MSCISLSLSYLNLIIFLDFFFIFSFILQHTSWQKIFAKLRLPFSIFSIQMLPFRETRSSKRDLPIDILILRNLSLYFALKNSISSISGVKRCRVPLYLLPYREIFFFSDNALPFELYIPSVARKLPLFRPLQTRAEHNKESAVCAKSTVDARERTRRKKRQGEKKPRWEKLKKTTRRDAL